MNLSGFLSGIVLVILGIILISFSLYSITEFTGKIMVILWGVIILGIGIYMLLNSNKEDKIEQIKRIKNQ